MQENLGKRAEVFLLSHGRVVPMIRPSIAGPFGRTLAGDGGPAAFSSAVLRGDAKRCILEKPPTAPAARRRGNVAGRQQSGLRMLLVALAGLVF